MTERNNGYRAEPVTERQNGSIPAKNRILDRAVPVAEGQNGSIPAKNRIIEGIEYELSKVLDPNGQIHAIRLERLDNTQSKLPDVAVSKEQPAAANPQSRF